MNDNFSNDDLFISEGVKWLAQMKLLNNPQLNDIIYGNIVSVSSSIDPDGTEILIDPLNEKMLILIKYHYWTRKHFTWRKGRIEDVILFNLKKLLPSFKFRIIEDKSIFDKAKQLFSLKGENKNEKPN